MVVSRVYLIVAAKVFANLRQVTLQIHKMLLFCINIFYIMEEKYFKTHKVIKE